MNYGPKIVTSGLVLCLDAADKKSYSGSGTAWNDLSGNNRNGTLTNGPTFSSANGGSVAFNGTNAYVAMPSGSLRSYTGTRSSASVWFKTAISSSTRQVIFGDWDSTGSLETARLELTAYGSPSSGKVGGAINYKAGDSQVPVDSTTTISTNVWYNVVLQYNGTSTELYLNGILEGSKNTSETGGNSTGQFAIARAGNFHALFLNGSIANVIIYNRALSATEVLQNFNATRGRFGI